MALSGFFAKGDVAQGNFNRELGQRALEARQTHERGMRGLDLEERTIKGAEAGAASEAISDLVTNTLKEVDAMLPDVVARAGPNATAEEVEATATQWVRSWYPAIRPTVAAADPALAKRLDAAMVQRLGAVVPGATALETRGAEARTTAKQTAVGSAQGALTPEAQAVAEAESARKIADARGVARATALGEADAEKILSPGGSTPAVHIDNPRWKEQALTVIGRKIAGSSSGWLGITPEEQWTYAMAYHQMTTPQIVAGPNGQKILADPTPLPLDFPRPGRPLDERDPDVQRMLSLQANLQARARDPENAPKVSEADQLEYVGLLSKVRRKYEADAAKAPRAGATTGAASGEIMPRTLSPEGGGRYAQVVTGTSIADELRSGFLGEGGEVDVDTYLLAWTGGTDIPFMGKGVPWTEGRNLRTLFEMVAADKLRIETGAQANAEEIRSVVDRYMPRLGDNEQGIKRKLDALVEFFETAYSAIDPKGFAKMRGRADRDPGEIIGYVTDPETKRPVTLYTRAGVQPSRPPPEFQGYEFLGLAREPGGPELHMFAGPDGDIIGVGP